MAVPPRCRIFSPSKTSGAVKAALEKKAELFRFRFFSSEGLIWTLVSAVLLIEVLLLEGCILRFVSKLVYPVSRDIAYFIEAPLLVISVVNAFTCFCVAFKSVLCRKSGFAELSLEQSRLLGLEDHGTNVLPKSPQTPITQLSQMDKVKKDRHFSFQWLSALQFGSLRNALKPRSRVHPTYEGAGSPVAAPGARSSSVLSSTGLSPVLASAFQSKRPLYDERDRSLAAEVGSRTSPYSKPTTSIQTSKQLEQLLDSSLPFDASTVSSPAVGFSASFGSSYGGQRRRSCNIGSQYQLLTSGSPAYELGTSFNEDDQSKNLNDENGVISLVTGSRIKVTSKRVSLSPIPLNLLKATAGLSTAGEGASNVEKGTSSRIVEGRNEEEDTTSFRIMLNNSRRSPRKTSGTRRSESWERRRAISISPVSNVSASPFSAAFAAADSSSPGALAKQISLSSAEILNQYKIDAEQFVVSERLLRYWICETIVRPLVITIDQMNDILLKDYSLLHLKIGRSTVQNLESALSTKPDLFSTQLPYIIPYMKVHEKQAYIAKRARVLSADIYMREYNWQSGGSEPRDKKTDDDQSYSPLEGPWGEHLPTDAQLVWSWFSVYMDARMAANSMAGDLQTPFTSVYFLKKPSKPSAVQCAPDSFYIHQVSIHPPQFELVIEGGRERFEMSRGQKNLWRTILLFLQHARLFNNNRVGQLALDETGINIAHILE